MTKKTIIQTASATLIATLAVAGITYAATPASNDTSLLNKGTVEVDSLKVGKQGSGGVTFFNGTIINNTTRSGLGVPVTFGDDVRVDGRVWRGVQQGGGLGDDAPFIINDDAQVAGSFTVGGTDIFAAIDAKGDKTAVQANTTAIATKANSADVYTKTQVDAIDATNDADISANRAAILSNDSDIAANTTAIANNASSITSKANSSSVYTKTEVDSKDAINASAIATNTSNIALKANSADVYTTTQSDANFLGARVTNYVTINPSAFTPEDPTTGYTLTNAILTVPTGTPDNDKWFVAPVILPYGVTVTGIRIVAFDNTAANSIVVELHQREHSVSATDSVVTNSTVTSVDFASVQLTDNAGTLSDVHNSGSKGYYLRAKVPVLNFNLYNVRIAFDDTGI